MWSSRTSVLDEVQNVWAATLDIRAVGRRAHVVITAYNDPSDVIIKQQNDMDRQTMMSGARLARASRAMPSSTAAVYRSTFRKPWLAIRSSHLTGPNP